MHQTEQEKQTVRLMIALYCRRKEQNKDLCDQCRQLSDYACRRLDACRYGDGKPVCKRCPTHCYAPEYRAKIRKVMRFSGPRMIFYHPIPAIRHMLGS